MAEYFKDNIKIIREKDPLLAARIESSATADVDIVFSKTGLPVPSAAGPEGRMLMVHSRVDPVREAERFASEGDAGGKDIIVVLGFGFGYHCEALMKAAGEKTLVISVDNNPAMLRSAMEGRDLSGLLGSENFYLLLEPGEEQVASVLKGRSSRNVVFMIHRGSYQLDPQYYSAALAMIKTFISTKDVNIATLARFEKTWCSNISRNIMTVSGAPGANIFFDRFAGMPAIVAAAGPSLTDSLDFIRASRNKAVIVAVDTSYKILSDNGITPHFCMSVDPQLINARYFEGCASTGTVLVADPAVHPSVFRFFSGRRVVTGVAFEMMKWIEDICGRKGDLAHGGSVSTSAYDFAKRLGASPVIMAGQDLAFTGGLAHAKGSYLDEQIHNKTYRFMNAQMYNRRQLTFLPPVFVPGKNGGTARTTQKMIIFRNWFENRNDPDLVNATHDGVFIKGARNIDHSSLSLAEQPVPPEKIIDDILASAAGGVQDSARGKIADRVNEMAREIDGLIPVLEKALSLASDLTGMIASGNDKNDPGKMGYILSKLQECDDVIESRGRSKGMLSFAMQRVIHTITEGYDTGKEADNAGTRSEFLYSGMLEAAGFISKLLGKMKVLLS